MPQKFRRKAGTGLLAGGSAIRSRPVAAAGIGYVAASWTGLEDQLVRLFEAVSAKYVVRSGDSFNYQHSVASGAILEALDSLHAKLAVIRAVVVERTTPEIIKLFDAMAISTRRAATSRNQIVHGHWWVSDAHPDALALKTRAGEHQLYQPRDFDEIARRIDVAALALAPVWDAALGYYADAIAPAEDADND